MRKKKNDIRREKRKGKSSVAEKPKACGEEGIKGLKYNSVSSLEKMNRNSPVSRGKERGVMNALFVKAK